MEILNFVKACVIQGPMNPFIHPAKDDITLEGLLAALGDPVRLQIIKILYVSSAGKNCSEAAPFPDMARSTLSSHFRILRESGLIRTQKKGVEHISVIRFDDLEARFPGFLSQVLSYCDA